MADPREITIEAKGSDIPFATSGLETPTIYAEDIRGAMRSEGVTKFNLVEYRMDSQSEELRAIHVANLVLPSDKVAAWGVFLLKLSGAKIEEEIEPDSSVKPSAEI